MIVHLLWLSWTWTWIRIRIRIQKNCWIRIRIRIKWMRIHSPDRYLPTVWNKLRQMFSYDPEKKNSKWYLPILCVMCRISRTCAGTWKPLRGFQVTACWNWRPASDSWDSNNNNNNSNQPPPQPPAIVIQKGPSPPPQAGESNRKINSNSSPTLFSDADAA